MTQQIAPMTPRAGVGKRVAAFVLLLALYQSAGASARLLHNETIANALMLTTLLAAPLLSRWLGWGWLGAHGLALRRGVGAIVLAGLAAAIAAKLIAVLVGAQLGFYALGGAAAVTPAQMLPALALAMLITAVPSLAEDILTRGFWLRGAAIAWTGAAFILTTSAIYLFNHIYQLDDGPIEWLRLFSFGLAYAAAAWRWQTLWAAFGLHWGWNLSNALIDAFARVETLAPDASALLSAGAHLVLAAAIVLAPRRGNSLLTAR